MQMKAIYVVLSVIVLTGVFAEIPKNSEVSNFTIIGVSPSQNYTLITELQNGRVIEVNNSGDIIWQKTGLRWVEDAERLSNGNTLIGDLNNHRVIEINKSGNIVWQKNVDMYGPADVERLDNGNTLITIGSSSGCVVEINKSGNIVWQKTGLNVPTDAERLNNGNTLVSIYGETRVIEINMSGNIVWQITGLRGARDVERLDNGNTLIVELINNRVIEVNKSGNIVWQRGITEPYDAERLSNGNTLIAYGTIGGGVIEVNGSGNIVWRINSNGPTDVERVEEPPNQLPVADAGPDQIVIEGNAVQFNALSSYDLKGTIKTYQWDFDLTNGLWWESATTPDATDPTPIHIYGDDGVYVATLRVTNYDNISALDTCNITVLNVNPLVALGSVTMNLEIGLRVAGRKFNDVGMTLFEDGNSVGYVSIERMPGSPDDQMAWIPINVDFLKSYTATVTYIPEDPPNIGANPVWIYIKSQNGSIKKLHHTFNVQQSKKRDSDHWNHIEPWEVNLSSHFIGLPFEITSQITDPGSDDEFLTYKYGSQIVNVTYLNNPPNSDLYPSPEYNPRDIIDNTFLIYEGIGIVTLIVKDDDNIRLGIGQGSDSISLA